MSWVVYIKPKARKTLIRIPKKDQDKIISALRSMEKEPLFGDITHLGDGRVRRRVGNYRIFFERPHGSLITIYEIKRRQSKTYS
jgi:mRNA-degrading endonuclease RelE of RelBE toxin-antitoxin system